MILSIKTSLRLNKYLKLKKIIGAQVPAVQIAHQEILYFKKIYHDFLIQIRFVKIKILINEILSYQNAKNVESH